MKTKNNPSSGFTLVELIIVLTIAIILATLGFVNYISYLRDGNDFKRISDITMIKSQLEIYKKNHSLLYPAGSGSTAIMSGSTVIAEQSFFDTYLAGKVWMDQAPLDPKTKTPYIYSVKSDFTSYQITATLENGSNLVSFFSSFPIESTFAASNDSTPTAYVKWTFIPTNQNTLPGLIYAVSTGSAFISGTPASFDISSAANIARVILNGQSTNLAYDMTKSMIGNNGTLSLSGLLASVSLTQNAGITNTATCTGVLYPTKTYTAGSNETWPYMTGTTTGTSGSASQIGWKYKTCSSSGTLLPTTGSSADTDWYYVCANMPGATFDAYCHWTACAAGYTVITGSTPSCKANLLPPTLSYPQNGGYGLPVAWALSWNNITGGNNVFKVYLGSSSTVWDIASWSLLATGTISYSYTGLTAGSTYFWKVNTCDVTGTTCLDSQIGSFTTASTGGGGNSGGATLSVTNAGSGCTSLGAIGVDKITRTQLWCDGTVWQNIAATSPGGLVTYSTPGTYTWIVPGSTTTVTVYAISGSAGGNNQWGSTSSVSLSWTTKANSTWGIQAYYGVAWAYGSPQGICGSISGAASWGIASVGDVLVNGLVSTGATLDGYVAPNGGTVAGNTYYAGYCSAVGSQYTVTPWIGGWGAIAKATITNIASQTLTIVVGGGYTNGSVIIKY